MTLKQYAEAIHDTWKNGRDERVFVLGENVQGAWITAQGKYGAQRDRHAAGESRSSGGYRGGAERRPVAGYSSLTSFFRGEPAESEAARIRYSTWLGLPIVVRAPFGGGISGALYHSQSVECCSSRAGPQIVAFDGVRCGRPCAAPFATRTGAVLRAQSAYPCRTTPEGDHGAIGTAAVRRKAKTSLSSRSFMAEPPGSQRSAATARLGRPAHAWLDRAAISKARRTGKISSCTRTT
jgi:hypothetical protein